MRFIDAHDFSVDLVLRVLGIASSTYYDWRTRRTSPSARACEDARLLGMIDDIRSEHEFAATYGSPRVWLELCRRGVRVGRKRVERIMREHGRARAPTCVGAGRVALPSRIRGTARHRTCSTATSPRPRPTASGSPT
jgi:HTH-like domain